MILFYLIYLLPANGQPVEISKIESLNLKFMERDLRKIERAKKILVGSLEKIGQNAGLVDFTQLVKLNEDIATSTATYFEVFDEYCRQFWIMNRKPVPAEVERAREFERRASGHFQQAAVLRQEGLKKPEHEDAAYFFAMGTELELLGLLNKARAIRIYHDFPVIYAYEWEDDVEVPIESPEKVARILALSTNPASPEPVAKPVQNKPSIVFIVQIAAHTIPLQESYLKTIYRGKHIIQMIHEDRWYKYYLGPFKSLGDAQQILAMVGVKNAFIAAYEDKKRINLREAMAKVSEQ